MMKAITFKQFIYTYNFRNIDDSKKYDKDQYNTTIIRIFPLRENFQYNEWFEFGIYDFSNKDYTWKNCEKVLSKEILNSYISSISYNEEFDNVVTIYLTNNSNCNE